MSDKDLGGKPSGQSLKSGYELTDISTKVVVVFATTLVVAGVIVHLLVWLLFAYLGQATSASYSRQYPLASVGPAPLPAPPMLQVKPREELTRLRADEDSILNSYGLIDPGRGIVRIPIDRAMQLVLERGLPVRPESGTVTTSQEGAATGPVRK